MSRNPSLEERKVVALERIAKDVNWIAESLSSHNSAEFAGVLLSVLEQIRDSQ